MPNVKQYNKVLWNLYKICFYYEGIIVTSSCLLKCGTAPLTIKCALLPSFFSLPSNLEL